MDFIESKGKTVDEAVFSGLLKMDLSIDEVEIEIVDEGGSLFKSARVKLTKKRETEIKTAVTTQETDYAKPHQSHSNSDNDTQRYSRERSGSRPQSERPSGYHRREGANRDNRSRDRSDSFVAPDPDFVPQEAGNEAEKFLLGLFSHMGLGVRLESKSEDGILKIDLSGKGMGLLIGRRGETLDALQYLTSLVVNSGKEDYTKIMLDTEDYRKKREDTLRRLAARLADRVIKSGKRVVLEPMNPYERRILHATLQDYDKVFTYSEGEDPFRSVVVALRGHDDHDASRDEKHA
jgi:spoIIIJ-associated protein